jgi:hypothetical protein
MNLRNATKVSVYCKERTESDVGYSFTYNRKDYNPAATRLSITKVKNCRCFIPGKLISKVLRN